MYEATIDHRHRQDKETTPARPHTQSPSEQPRESATRTGCRAGDQQQEHRHYDAASELTQRAANPAREDNGFCAINNKQK